MIRKYGGLSGVRDIGMLESAIHRPFSTFAGDDLYKGIYFKAAAFMQSLIKNHPFIDGNKRTAFVGAYIFLKRNNITMTVTQRQIVAFISKVANENLSVDEIASWLKQNSKN